MNQNLYPQYPQSPAQPPYTPPPQTNGLAIASLVLSILGLVGLLPLLGTILGLIFGYSAKTRSLRVGASREVKGWPRPGLSSAGSRWAWMPWFSVWFSFLASPFRAA